MIDVSVLAESASPYGINDARQSLQRHGLLHGLLAIRFGSDAPLLDAAYALGLYADAGANLGATSAAAHEVFGW